MDTYGMARGEMHATPAEDWRDYGNNLAGEAHYQGEQFNNARRLLLCAWDGWTSGEPPKREIVRELLATFWAMSMSTGIAAIEGPLEAFAARLTEIIEREEA
jgi:hypothetical protein